MRDLEHTVLNGMSPSNPSTQNSGNPQEGVGGNTEVTGPLNQHDQIYEATEVLCTGPA